METHCSLLFPFHLIGNIPIFQVKNRSGNWIEVSAPSHGKYSIIVNLGDMLQKLTQGLYRSTPHKVVIKNDKQRISLPFFYDPSWSLIVNDYLIPLSEKKLQKIKDENRQISDFESWNKSHYDYVKQKAIKSYPQLYKHLL